MAGGNEIRPPLELRGRLQPPLPFVLVLLCSAVSAAVGLAALVFAFSVRTPTDRVPLAGFGAFFLLIALLNISIMRLPSRPMLRLDDRGVTLLSGFSRAWRRLPWNEILDMRLISVPMLFFTMQRVLIVPRSPDSFINQGQTGFSRTMVLGVVKRYGGVLAPPTDMPAPQLLEELREWRAYTVT